MKYLIMMFLMVLLGSAYSQDATVVGNSPCSKRLYVKSHLYKKYPFDFYKDFLQNYVNNNYPQSVNYITSNSDDLQLFSVEECCGDKVIMRKKSCINEIVEVVVLTDKLELDLDRELINSDPYSFLQFEIEKALGFNYFGNVKNDAGEIRQIKEIICKTSSDTIRVNQRLFRDLLNPNLCSNYASIKPIQAYFDSSKNLVYIYVEGALPNKDIALVDSSYVAKIIINLATKKVSRIVVPGGYLSSYGWMYCSRFWTM